MAIIDTKRLPTNLAIAIATENPTTHYAALAQWHWIGAGLLQEEFKLIYMENKCYGTLLRVP